MRVEKEESKAISDILVIPYLQLSKNYNLLFMAESWTVVAALP